MIIITTHTVSNFMAKNKTKKKSGFRILSMVHGFPMVFCGLDFIHDLGLFVLMFLMGNGEQVSVLGRYGPAPREEL